MAVRADVTVAEMGNFRRLTVGPPGQENIAIVLMAILGAPLMDDQTADEVRNPGVEGIRWNGIDSSFRDPSGNAVRLTQPREVATWT